MAVPVIVLNCDGTKEGKFIESFVDIKQLVGGYVTIIAFDKSVLCVNKDGEMRKLKHNLLATILATQFILGTAVFISKEDFENLPYGDNSEQAEDSTIH